MATMQKFQGTEYKLSMKCGNIATLQAQTQMTFKLVSFNSVQMGHSNLN